MKSIVSNEKRCWICETERNLHRHHVFYGAGRRSTSEKYGCWVYLCGYHHNMSDKGIHFNKEVDLQLKRLTQRKWEDKYGSRDDFIRTFGKSYL